MTKSYEIDRRVTARVLTQGYALGLPEKWMVQAFRNQRRTITYWRFQNHRGRTRVPTVILDYLDSIEDKVEATVKEYLGEIANLPCKRLRLFDYRDDSDVAAWETGWSVEALPKRDIDGVIDPETYTLSLPSETFSIMIYRLWRKLRPDYDDLNIIMFDPEEYQAWLGKKKNTLHNRLRWASERHIENEYGYKGEK